MDYITLSTLKAAAQQVGIQVLAVLQTSHFQADSADLEKLQNWQSNGFGGEMPYMHYKPEQYLDLERILSGTKSVIFIAARYDTNPTPARPNGFGRVARYAWGLDYHNVLKNRLNDFMTQLQNSSGRKINHRIFSDAVPLLERALAKKAGLGFVGKNTLLIQRTLGSFFFIAEVLCDVECEPTPRYTGNCGSCTRCQTNCPTSALVADYQLDARKCISYLTIEKRTALSLTERQALGEWLFGCDVCQEVCPFNHRELKQPTETSFSEFLSTKGVGGVLELKHILGLRDNKQFKLRFAESPLLRAKRQGLLRNAACVAANTLAYDCIPALELALSDSSALVRQHSLWALSKLLNPRQSKVLIEKHLKDQDELVANEAKALLELGDL